MYNLLKRHEAHLVTHDMPKSATPFAAFETDIIYQRFHGPTGNYRGEYDESFLAECASYVQQWMRAGRTVYVYFNNTGGNAFQNLISLKHALRETR